MTSIEDQKDFLVSIKRKKDVFQQLQSNLEYNKIYGFGANAT